MTVRQIMNLGLWEKVCEYKEWNPWILNEGRISENDDVTFDDEFNKENKFDMTVLSSTADTLMKAFEKLDHFVESETEKSGARVYLNSAILSLSRAIESVDNAIEEYS